MQIYVFSMQLVPRNAVYDLGDNDGDAFGVSGESERQPALHMYERGVFSSFVALD